MLFRSIICTGPTYYLQAGFWCQLKPCWASSPGPVTELSYAWLHPATAKLMAILAPGFACTRRLIALGLLPLYKIGRAAGPTAMVWLGLRDPELRRPTYNSSSDEVVDCPSAIYASQNFLDYAKCLLDGKSAWGDKKLERQSTGLITC